MLLMRAQAVNVSNSFAFIADCISRKLAGFFHQCIRAVVEIRAMSQLYSDAVFFDLGRAEKVIVTARETTVIGGAGDPAETRSRVQIRKLAAE
jgi:hypothetical protein